MSEFRVEVVRIQGIQPVPNSDTLDYTKVHQGYPCIFKRGDFQDGDLAVYVPIDSVMPDLPQWAFLLRGHSPTPENRRIRALKLRGTFSMGLLTALPMPLQGIHWEVGDDVQQVMGITRYQFEPTEATAGQEAPPTGICETYDVEGQRRYPDLFLPDELVVVTEKIDGVSVRFQYDGEKLRAGTHKAWWREDSNHWVWDLLVSTPELRSALLANPGYTFYGEAYGKDRPLRYGIKPAEPRRLAFFDIREHAGTWHDADYFKGLCAVFQLPTAPILYRGPYDPAILSLANGHSVMPGAGHIREGIVIRPQKERFSDTAGRVILKLHGEQYLLKHA